MEAGCSGNLVSALIEYGRIEIRGEVGNSEEQLAFEGAQGAQGAQGQRTSGALVVNELGWLLCKSGSLRQLEIAYRPAPFETVGTPSFRIWSTHSPS